MNKQGAIDLLSAFFTVEGGNCFGNFEKTGYQDLDGDPIYQANVSKADLIELIKAVRIAGVMK